MTLEEHEHLFDTLSKECSIPRVNGKLVLICTPGDVSLAEQLYGESRRIVASPMLGDAKAAHNPHDAFLHVRNKRTKRKKR